ncbi:hypothetical protein SAMN05660691_00933 [Rheinheimera pacifica]|uniref:Uncharacterized protein n=1 Tax=Rheinheimera pacifica TaxID=173990 RepID=A0A1H6K7G4_9GAMM|nr:hypothetical protein SAMN05660691_00933 [Rheinheimera pacifica]
MWNLPTLLLEVWMCPDENNLGEYLPACLPFGPEGDAARSLIDPDSFCLLVFFAESHFDAMSYYYRLVHNERYTTNNPEDYRPYPAKSIEIQRKFLSRF